MNDPKCYLERCHVTTNIIVHFEKLDQGSLKLIYEDDGVGIPLENKPSLFKEGFSTGGNTGSVFF